MFLSIIGFLIALITKKDDKYVMFYAKESLVLFIAALALNIAGSILIVMTLGIFAIIMPLISLFLMVLWIILVFITTEIYVHTRKEPEKYPNEAHMGIIVTS